MPQKKFILKKAIGFTTTTFQDVATTFISTFSKAMERVQGTTGPTGELIESRTISVVRRGHMLCIELGHAHKDNTIELATHVEDPEAIEWDKINHRLPNGAKRATWAYLGIVDNYVVVHPSLGWSIDKICSYFDFALSELRHMNRLPVSTQIPTYLRLDDVVPLDKMHLLKDMKSITISGILSSLLGQDSRQFANLNISSTSKLRQMIRSIFPNLLMQNTELSVDDALRTGNVNISLNIEYNGVLPTDGVPMLLNIVNELNNAAGDMDNDNTDYTLFLSKNRQIKGNDLYIVDAKNVRERDGILHASAYFDVMEQWYQELLSTNVIPHN